MSDGINLWLDDERPAPEGWVRVKTPEAAIALLDAGHVAVLSLDHDLGLDEARTGYTVAAYIEQAAFGRTLAPLDVHIHTANPVGRRRMQQALANAAQYWARAPEETS